MAKTENSPYLSPWHLDCRLSAQLPSDDLIRGAFLLNLVAASVASAVVILAFWQIYVSGSLSSEIKYWEEQITVHQRQFAELNAATRKLDTQVARLDAAYDLMAQPYVVSDLVINIARTRLPKMSIVSLNGFAGGVVLRGTLDEPSSQAAQTLRRYRNDLLKDPAIGPLFANIVLVSLDRGEGNDIMTFEIDCKLKGAAAPPP